MNIFPHHKNCNPNYPEKPKGEKPQHITRQDLGDGEVLFQCVDCGAHILTREKKDAPIKRSRRHSH